jgi:hypothetical protein
MCVQTACSRHGDATCLARVLKRALLLALVRAGAVRAAVDPVCAASRASRKAPAAAAADTDQQ